MLGAGVAPFARHSPVQRKPVAGHRQSIGDGPGSNPIVRGCIGDALHRAGDIRRPLLQCQ
jgi:hypothetical protein